MTDEAAPLRLLVSAHAADYRANLQFCCDHYRSVSEVCRRLAINRQQFNRYLAGTAAPSRHNHRRISDFFGLEDHELLAPHEAFAATFARRAAARRPSEARGPRAALDLQAALLRDASLSGSRSLAEYRGFYFKYFHSYLGDGRIKRELAHWRPDGDALVSSVKQRLTEEDGDATLRFATWRGLVGAVGDRLTVIDVQRGAGRETSMMVLYPKGRLLGRLHGLTLGVSHGAARAIGAARVVMDFLGTEVDVGAALRALGTFAPDDPAVPEPIRRAVANDVRPDEVLFLARP